MELERNSEYKFRHIKIYKETRLMRLKEIQKDTDRQIDDETELAKN